MKNLKYFGVFFSLIFFLQVSPTVAQSRCRVVVAIPPLAEMVAAVGSDRVKVSSLVAGGANPHTFEPTAATLKEVAEADIFVKLGSGLESELMWLDKLPPLNKKMLLCDSSRGIVLKNKDPHIWPSLKNAQIMVANILNCLVQFEPAHRQFYKKNAGAYQRRLQKLDHQFQRSFSDLKNRSFLVFHPGWAYFAADYGLKEVAIEIAGKEPRARELAEIIETAKKEKVRVIFVSPQFSQKAARVIGEQLKLQVVEVDNLSEHYLESVDYFGRKLLQCLK